MNYTNLTSKINEIIRPALNSGTKEQVMCMAINILADLFNLSIVSVHHFDKNNDVIKVIDSKIDRSLADNQNLNITKLSNSIEWEAIKYGKRMFIENIESRNKTSGIDQNIQTEVIIPICDGYLIIAGNKEERIDITTVDAIDILATFAKLAVSKIEQQSKFRQQNQKFEDIKELHSQMCDLVEIPIEANSQKDIEDLTCEKLGLFSSVDFVWTGRVRPQYDCIVPQVQSGVSNGYIEDISLDIKSGNREPSVQAACSKTPHNLSDTIDAPNADWQSAAIERGFRSILSIPMIYRDNVHGVVSMYSAKKDNFSSLFSNSMSKTVDLISDAIYSEESSINQSSGVIQKVSLNVSGNNNRLHQLAGNTVCRIEIKDFIPKSESSVLVLMKVNDCAVKKIISRSMRISGIETWGTPSNTNSLLQLKFERPFVGTELREEGFKISKFNISSNTSTLSIHMPQDSHISKLNNIISSRFNNVELLSKVHSEMSSSPLTASQKTIFEALTSRQREIIEIAYEEGYFQSPREASGSDIAESLDITSTTFHSHLRKAEETIFNYLLNDNRS